MKDWLKKLVPESRKLSALLLAMLGYALHTQFPFLTEDQVLTLLGMVGAWMGFQAISDAGAQGKAIAEIRKAKKAGLDPAKVIAAVSDKHISPDDMKLIAEQMQIVMATLSKLEQIAEKADEKAKESNEEATEESASEGTPSDAPEDLEAEDADEKSSHVEDAEDKAWSEEDLEEAIEKLD
jgi:hypothetical protein